MNSVEGFVKFINDVRDTMIHFAFCQCLIIGKVTSFTIYIFRELNDCIHAYSVQAKVSSWLVCHYCFGF